MKYQKLVRDRIPEIIEKTGEKPVKRVLGDEEYAKELAKKLMEEAQEFVAASTPESQLEELADVEEIILAELERLGKTREELEKVRKAKAAKRGGFDKRIFLEVVAK